MSSAGNESDSSAHQERNDADDVEMDDSFNKQPEPKTISLEEYKRYQELFAPKLLSDTEELQAKQLVQDALSANNQDAPMEEDYTIEATLQLLKSNLDAARADVEKLCHEGAILTTQQRQL